MLLGLGPITAGFLNGFLANLFTPEGGALDYSKFWYSMAFIGLIATVMFGVFFRDETAGQGANPSAKAADGES